MMDWYQVRLADSEIRLEVAPPGGEAWQETIPWSEIVRVCFEAGDLWISDTWYVFIRGREESYPIPVEADGGQALLGALLDRRLFDADLAIQASGATNQIFCWPEPSRADPPGSEAR